MRDCITLAAVGDVALTDYLRKFIYDFGPMWPFEPCRPALQADLLFGNLECIIFRPPWPDQPPNGETFHVAWPEALGLAEAGFSVLAMANNHVLDYGPERAFQTIEFCRDHNIATVGFGRDPAAARRAAILERRGIRVGFLAYVEDVPGLRRQVSPGPAYIAEQNIRQDIADLRRAGTDIVVVSLHADLEFADHPAPLRVALSRRLIDAGATVLLQHHPHVPQAIERYHAGLIAYSLGNFVFPVAGDPYLEQAAPWTSRSFILRVELDKHGCRAYELVPVQIETRGRPIPVPAAATLVGYAPCTAAVPVWPLPDAGTVQSETRPSPLLIQHTGLSTQDLRRSESLESLAAEFFARQHRLNRDLGDPAALERAWAQTARRWWRTNLEWLVTAARQAGPDHAAGHFLQEFLYEENIHWLRRILRDLSSRLPPRVWEKECR